MKLISALLMTLLNNLKLLRRPPNQAHNLAMIDMAWNCREANWFLAVRALSAIMNKYNLRNNTQGERRLHEKYCVRTKR